MKLVYERPLSIQIVFLRSNSLASLTRHSTANFIPQHHFTTGLLFHVNYMHAFRSTCDEINF